MQEQTAEIVMERLNIPSGTLTFTVKDRNRLEKADKQATNKEKCHQGQKLVRVRRQEALPEMEGVTYEAGGY